MLQTRNLQNADGTLPQLLTVLEVSNVLRIGVSTLYQLVGRQEIPCIRIGRSVRFRLEDVENFINSQRSIAGEK